MRSLIVALLHRSVICFTGVLAIITSPAQAQNPPSPHPVSQSQPAAKVAPASAQRTLVIVHAPALRDIAREWTDYRTFQNWKVITHETAALPAKPAADADADRINADREAQRQVILKAIRAAHTSAHRSDVSHFAVLLLGDDDTIPPWSFSQTDPLMLSENDREYISDLPYQLADDKDEKADFPLGRVPARTAEQARAVLHKIQQHEQAEHTGRQRSRISYVAGEGHFGPLDAVLEMLFVMMVDRFVPDAFDLTMTYAKSSSIYCPPPSELTATVLHRLTEGAALFNYVGHGHEQGLDSLHWNGKRFPILRVSDLKSLDASAMNDRQRPVAFMSCCSVGHFDLPRGDLCLSEALLFHPAGPIAIISGSRITHPYANTILQKDITHTLLIDRAPTAGMLDLLAERSLVTIDATDQELDWLAGTIARSQKWKTSLRDLRLMHAEMYNLLGDPATELSLPAMSVRNLSLRDGLVSGSVEGMVSGQVLVEIETPRAEVANPSRLMPIGGGGDDDPDLERKAANNYPIANDRVLLRIEGEIKDGAFSLKLPEALPPNAGMVRVGARGVDTHGKTVESIGALRLKQSTTTKPDVSAGG